MCDVNILLFEFTDQVGRRCRAGNDGMDLMLEFTGFGCVHNANLGEILARRHPHAEVHVGLTCTVGAPQ